MGAQHNLSPEQIQIEEVMAATGDPEMYLCECCGKCDQYTGHSSIEACA